MAGRIAPRTTVPDPRHNPLAQINRIALSHDPPPITVNHIPAPSGIPFDSFFKYEALAKEARLLDCIFEKAPRGAVFTNSGTTSIASVVGYLAAIHTPRIHIVNPAYHAVAVLARSYGIETVPIAISRIAGRYRLPNNLAIGESEALWLTSPVYGASVYLDPDYVAGLIDSLPSSAPVVVDESLAYLDRSLIRSVRSVERFIRIVVPHKPLCSNGEKVSIITMPAHLADSIETISECLAGGIGASGTRALNFLMSPGYAAAQEHCRALCAQQHRRMRNIIRNFPAATIDADTDGHFVLVYWSTLSMDDVASLPFMTKLIEASGAAPMPASRNCHPSEDGFCFRVNLLRLDNAGLSGLKRLCDVLASYA